MHKDFNYSSIFADLISTYIQSRREAGFMFDNPAYWLFRFDQFCKARQINKTEITKELYDSWSAKQLSESKTTQSNRLQALRCFSIHLNSIGIPSYIPTQLPRPEKTVPYLMSDEDVREFFKQVDLYESDAPVKAFERLATEYKVLFRLIYCCGLRNNEACTLRLEDVDTDSGTLTIIHSKGNKDRIVYLSDDVCQLCAEYKQWLKEELSDTYGWFFPGKYPDKCIPKTSVDRKFNEFWNSTQASQKCDKKPTVHCLRHAFVIKRINLWMESDISLRVMMPYLSSYLGHKGPMESYYYYHLVQDAFNTIRRKDTITSRVIPEVQHEE